MRDRCCTFINVLDPFECLFQFLLLYLWSLPFLLRTGDGTISAAGGNGWGGGGGGRISVDCYSIQQDVTITVHG